jgi:hypothetical protein
MGRRLTPLWHGLRDRLIEIVRRWESMRSQQGPTTTPPIDGSAPCLLTAFGTCTPYLIYQVLSMLSGNTSYAFGLPSPC